MFQSIKQRCEIIYKSLSETSCIPLDNLMPTQLHSTQHFTAHTIGLSTAFHFPRHSIVHFTPLSTTFHPPLHSTVHDILPSTSFCCPRHSIVHFIPLSTIFHHAPHFTVHDIPSSTSFHWTRHSTIHFIPLSTTFHCPCHSIPLSSPFLGTICGPICRSFLLGDHLRHCIPNPLSCGIYSSFISALGLWSRLRKASMESGGFLQLWCVFQRIISSAKLDHSAESGLPRIGNTTRVFKNHVENKQKRPSRDHCFHRPIKISTGRVFQILRARSIQPKFAVQNQICRQPIVLFPGNLEIPGIFCSIDHTISPDAQPKFLTGFKNYARVFWINLR